jgi:hypothetical protein
VRSIALLTQLALRAGLVTRPGPAD